jgi:hypothetical protein
MLERVEELAHELSRQLSVMDSTLNMDWALAKVISSGEFKPNAVAARLIRCRLEEHNLVRPTQRSPSLPEPQSVSFG